MSSGQWLKRKWRKFYLKIVREKATPEYIARGWSIGMFFGCLIPFGLQLICSVPAAFLLKGSKIGAVLGTFITNHFSIFIIYPVQCYAGAKLLGMDISYNDVVSKLGRLVKEQSFEALDALRQDAGGLVAGFFLGGAIMAAVLTPITYFAVKRMVVTYRAQIEKRRMLREKKMQERRLPRAAAQTNGDAPERP